MRKSGRGHIVVALITGTTIRGWRKAKGLQAQFVASAVGLSKQQFSYLEKGQRSIDVNEFVAIMKAMGYKPGDVLENSGGVREDLKPIVGELEKLRPATIGRVREILRVVDAVAVDAEAVAPKDNIIAFPSGERTPPRWTPEFPVHPADFNEKGDTDFPIDLHGWEMDDIDAAAGDVGIQNAENQMGTILNMREVREGRVRSIRVKGNSMAPTFEHGWLLAVDVTQRKPKNEDPVLVYRHDTDGMILGRWEKRGERVRLLKDNDAFDPVELLEGDQLVGTIIDIIKKPVPPPPARRKR